MWEKDCGCLPVVDAVRVVRAVITDRDICMAALTQGVPLAETSVASAMSRSLTVCSPDDPLGAVEDVMRQGQIRSIQRQIGIDRFRRHEHERVIESVVIGWLILAKANHMHILRKWFRAKRALGVSR